MAAVTVTAANVRLVSGETEHGLCGAAIDAGQVVTGTGTPEDKYMLSDADNVDAEPTGIALCKGYADVCYIVIAKPGAVVNIGGTLVVTTAYYVHPTAGSIGLEADVLSGDYAYGVGFGKTTANLEFKVSSASQVKP